MTYDDVIRLQFKRLRFQTFTAWPLIVDKCTIGTSDVLDVILESGITLMCPRERKVRTYLSVLFPYFGMLPAEDFWIKVTVTFC